MVFFKKKLLQWKEYCWFFSLPKPKPITLSPPSHTLRPREWRRGKEGKIGPFAASIAGSDNGEKEGSCMQVQTGKKAC